MKRLSFLILCLIGFVWVSAKTATAEEVAWNPYEEKFDKYEGFVSTDKTKFWLTKVYCNCWKGDVKERVCKNTTVIIPETIRGYQVTKVGLKRTNHQRYDDYLYPNFVFCDMVKFVGVPDTVTELGYDCFLGLKRLEEVKLSSKIKEIPTGTFYECSIKRMHLNEGIETIHDYAFGSCTMEKTSLPTTLQSIGEGAFEYCSNLKEITIPDDVEIGYRAFDSCFNLESVSFGQKNKIKGGCFNNCVLVKNVEIPKDNGFIYKDKVFYSKKRDKVISVIDADGTYKVPKGVKEIAPYAFYRMRKIKRVTFDKNVKKIGKKAFYGILFSNMKLPKGLKTLGENCLGVANYQKLTIPSGVQKISKVGILEPGYKVKRVSCTVSKKNKRYASKNGNLYLKKSKERVPVMVVGTSK